METPSAGPGPLGPERAIRLLLEYDGTDFQGWQIQPHGRTIQAELAGALRTLLREEVRPTAAGRTDAGVHALGQVAHFHTRAALPPDRIRQGLNGLLPADISVLAAAEAAPDFHARYSATAKRYRYRIRLDRAALERNQVWSCYHPLDLATMAQACRALTGTHCFAAFCKQDPVPPSFACRVFDCSWNHRGRELVFEIEGDRFLRHMVRIIVGTAVEVGRGRRPPDDMSAVLESGDRARAGPTAPASGLCLVRVSYAEDG